MKDRKIRTVLVLLVMLCLGSVGYYQMNKSDVPMHSIQVIVGDHGAVREESGILHTVDFKMEVRDKEPLVLQSVAQEGHQLDRIRIDGREADEIHITKVTSDMKIRFSFKEV